MATKFSKVMTYLQGLARSREQLKIYLHYLHYMATKLGRFVTYYKELPPIKLQDPSVTWSCEVTWQIKNVISLLAEGLIALS